MHHAPQLTQGHFFIERGSTVRVRQRALQNPRITGFLFRIDLQILEHGAGMEPFMEPSGRKPGPSSRVAWPRSTVQISRRAVVVAFSGALAAAFRRNPSDR